MSNEWMDRANCVTRGDVSPDMMQPERATRREVEEAKAVCEGCPVKAQCRELAESQTSRLGGTSAYGVHAGEWWGPDPIWETERLCEDCGALFRTEVGSRQARFCSHRCQKKAYRARMSA